MNEKIIFLARQCIACQKSDYDYSIAPPNVSTQSISIKLTLREIRTFIVINKFMRSPDAIPLKDIYAESCAEGGFERGFTFLCAACSNHRAGDAVRVFPFVV